MTPPGRLNHCTVVLLAALAGCGGFGRVRQGQVIEYERDLGLVTLIQDSNFQDPSRPRFDVLPPTTVRVPLDATEMGPEPEAGKLLEFDPATRRAVIFDAGARTLRTVAYTPIREENDVVPTDARIRRHRFPVVDRVRKTVQAYLPRLRKLATFSVADEYFALPDDTWKVGDEIRYYAKDPGRALRMMNVTKTDLNRAGK